MNTRDKLGTVRGLLPRNLIGDHAYSHLEHRVRRQRYTGHKVRTLQSITDSAKFRLRRVLAIDPDLHRHELLSEVDGK